MARSLCSWQCRSEAALLCCLCLRPCHTQPCYGLPNPKARTPHHPGLPNPGASLPPPLTLTGSGTLRAPKMVRSTAMNSSFTCAAVFCSRCVAYCAALKATSTGLPAGSRAGVCCLLRQAGDMCWGAAEGARWAELCARPASTCWWRHEPEPLLISQQHPSHQPGFHFSRAPTCVRQHVERLTPGPGRAGRRHAVQHVQVARPEHLGKHQYELRGVCGAGGGKQSGRRKHGWVCVGNRQRSQLQLRTPPTHQPRQAAPCPSPPCSAGPRPGCPAPSGWWPAAPAATAGRPT